ncbi:pilus assembly protein [Altererythrobacter sp.]|nr:pilus assembly protein [Altererythrobacter sp.]
MLNKLQCMLRETSGVALTEFALMAPVVLTAGLYGLEAANLAITHMKVSQAAMQIADNATRIGETSVLDDRKIYEDEIIDIFVGSDLQFGQALDLFEHGRVILSSQEVDPDDSTDTQQYIHWQRCKGERNYDSAYGVEGTGKGDLSFKGMGPPGEEILALPGDAVMFVEIQYEYQPLVTDAFIGTRVITVESSFNVRGDRDLSQIYQKDPSNPVDAETCDKFDKYRITDAPRVESGGYNWQEL